MNGVLCLVLSVCLSHFRSDCLCQSVSLSPLSISLSVYVSVCVCDWSVHLTTKASWMSSTPFDRITSPIRNRYLTHSLTLKHPNPFSPLCEQFVCYVWCVCLSVYLFQCFCVCVCWVSPDQPDSKMANCFDSIIIRLAWWWWYLTTLFYSFCFVSKTRQLYKCSI